MAYTTINKSTDYFNTKLYTGNGSTNAITGVGFQPDWVWIKDRDGTGYHFLTDAVRGVTKTIYSNVTNAETTEATGLTAFGTDGFTVGSHGNINTNGRNIASWNWKAGGGQGSSNTDGSINTTYTSANTTAGFSISTYTGTGSNATVGHGLGAAPQVVWIKRLSNVDGIVVGHKSMGFNKLMKMDRTNAEAASSNYFQDTAPSSSVVSIGSDTGVGSAGNTYVMYAFAEKKGYSKFGSYTGNGNANGTFIYTGFAPSFVIMKRTDSTGAWYTLDNKRPTYNPKDKYLSADSSNAESTFTFWDFLSNGFKIRNTGTENNASGGSYIFMAFGQSLVGNNNIPCTAR